ncbi:UNVERIFIED_CONTAM: putative galacturonosyltransferase 4 [Sesamum radiatum]|uniref:Galacturonosyltransferase 4 n=1 Tax=Sesamum radiatum TaxID=300843 RepID=A0AAW2KGT8_SESRA
MRMKLRRSVLFLLLVTVFAPIVLYTDTLGASDDLWKMFQPFQAIKCATSEHSTESSSNYSDASSRENARIPDSSLEELKHPEHSSQPRKDISRKQVKSRTEKQNEQTGLPDAHIRQLKDQLIRARIYLSLSATRNNPHFIKELRLRMKEILRTLGEATKDSELPKNALQKLKAMEQTLSRGKQIQDDCATVVKKLRAMLHSTEEQLRVHKKQTLFLTHLTANTMPKGLHCLPLRLSTDYFRLNKSQRHFVNEEKLDDPKLYHYALFSDNVLAAAVVVNSTITHAKVKGFFPITKKL